VIVTCEQCGTQFQLDDAKVPEDGIRVRCSRCKHAFFVESPQRPDVDRADSMARDALAEDPVPAAGQAPEPSRSEEGESDWQFNEDIEQPQASGAGYNAPVTAEAAVDDLLGGDVGESLEPPAAGLEDGIDLGGPDLDVDVSPSLEIGDGDDLDLSPPPEEPPAAAAFDLDAGSAPDLPEDTPELETSPALESEGTFGDPLEDLGDPDDWEKLVPDEAPPAEVGEAAVAHTAQTAQPAPAEAGIVSDVTAAASRYVEEPALDADIDEVASPVWIVRARGVVAWALVSLLCAYAGMVGLWPSYWTALPEEGPLSVAGLYTESIHGRWIENAVAGPIYVVSGGLHARSAASLPGETLLRIRLLDASGAPIAAESAVVAPPLTTEQLREWNLPDLREVQEAGAVRQAWEPLAPGDRRPFVAIVGRVPPSAAAFEFQATAAASPVSETGEGAGIPDPYADLVVEGMIE
jgi:predicted Zn finger-like uncharacterized protein